MDFPRLPWELIERIIGHSGDHASTLCSLSRTCRQLRPRALCLMVAHVTLQSRARIFDFCAFLHAKPHLNALVRSAMVDPTDFAPVPFLRILPNLSELRFTSRETIIALHQSNLTCFRHYATHVQTLHLSNVSFSTYLPLARVLLAFTNLVHLTCTDIKFTASEKQLPHLGVLQQRLSQRLKLRSLAIDPSSPIRWENHDPSMPVEGLLFGPDLAPTLESLKLKLISSGLSNDSWRFLAQVSDWSRLQSLVLQIPQERLKFLPWAIDVLERAYGPNLQNVALILGPVDTARELPLSDTHPNDVCHKLQQALLKFSQPMLTWVTKIPVPAGRTSFWMREMERRFPTLSQRGLVALRSTSESDSPIAYGHDGALRALAISPTGKWVASGSDDFTIILWDTTDGKMAYQWVPHGYNSVVSLAFSPDGQYLLSGSQNATLVIWDLSEHAQCRWKVAMLEGHTASISSCAWSSDGATIASGSFDGRVVVWDTHTFAKRHVLKKGPSHFEARYLSFSPDGRWLASWFFPSGFCLWDVASGTPRKFVQPDPTMRVHRLDIAAAFDPDSLHLATVSRWDGVEVWAVETGTRRAVLRRAGEVQDVSFSPEGRLLVTASSDRSVRIWDARTGGELLRLGGHTNIVSKAYFSPCGKYVASGSWDGTVRVWGISDGSCVASFSEHEECVSHLFFSPDGTTLWSGERNGTIVHRSMRNIVPVDE